MIISYYGIREKYRLYELTPGLWFLFSNKDQKINEVNNLCNTILKRWTDTLNFTDQPNSGGWWMASVQGEVVRLGRKFLTAISAMFNILKHCCL